MEVNSVVISKSPNSKLLSTSFLSPGKNPFDDVWKKTIDPVSISEQISRRSSVPLFTDFPNNGRRSLSFCDLNASDFGRESMGILPPDCGRDSLGFMNISNLEIDYESLGIIQINALRESLSFRRESLGILHLQDLGRESLDCGRESLGILHLKSPDVKFGDEEKRIPDIMLTTIEENSDGLCNTLDTAFLQPYSRRFSSVSSSSSINPSFNSLSLEGPSRIYSISSTKSSKDMKSEIISNTDNFTNLTYSSSSVLSSIHSPLNRGKLFSPSDLSLRTRIHSVPLDLPDKFSPLNYKGKLEDVSERKFWSTDRTTHSKNLERRSFHEILDFKEAERSNEFHDSVFGDSRLFSEKVTDGSILNDSLGEVGLLDCTPQPDWPDDLSYCDNKDEECQKCDTQTVFKTVDKMLPQPVQDILNVKLKPTRTESHSSNDNEAKINTIEENREKINTSEANNSKSSQTSEHNVSKLLQNISDIQHEPKKLSSTRKDPKEILENLSELWNSTNRSDKQKSEGQNLLNSLAEMLCQSKSSTQNNLDDSGHSSINERSDSLTKDNHGCFEVLDEHTSKQNISGNTDRPNLPLKSKTIENLINRGMSQSLSSSSTNVKLISHIEKKNTSLSDLDVNRNKTRNCSIVSNDSKNSSHLVKPQISGKLRQKHFNSNKGPMKAIIPVNDMKKKDHIPITPERNEQKITMQSKRTSTPINEPKLKPMAASTPTTRPINEISESSKDRKSNMLSSLTRSRKSISSGNFTRERAYTSTCLPKSSAINKSKLRRNSVSDVNKSNETVGTIRRKSVEKESEIMSSIDKARQNLGGSPYHQTQNPRIENKTVSDNKRKLRENRHSFAKSSNLETKSKTFTNVTSDKQKQDVTFAQSPSKVISSVQQKTSKMPTFSPSHLKTKIEVRYERRNSISEAVRNKPSNGKVTRSNSMSNETGMMSSLPKIRQNMLDSPYFHLKKEDKLNKNYVVLSENQKIDRTHSAQFPQLKKTGKENIRK